jgi:alpha-L-fucosidase
MFPRLLSLMQTTRRTGLVCLALATLPAMLHAQGASAPTAPPASADPALIDQAWQNASAKYDASRESLLKEVDRVGHEGPFRSDWESLQTY